MHPQPGAPTAPYAPPQVRIRYIRVCARALSDDTFVCAAVAQFPVFFRLPMVVGMLSFRSAVVVVIRVGGGDGFTVYE